MRSLIQYLSLLILILNVVSACGRMEMRASEVGKNSTPIGATTPIEPSMSAYPLPPVDDVPTMPMPPPPTEAPRTPRPTWTIHPSAFPGAAGALLVPTRDRLRICVEIHPKVPGDHISIMKTIEESLATVKSEHHNWEYADYGEVPELETCPPGTPSVAHPDSGPVLGRAVTPEEASPYRTIIYVVDAQTMQQMRGQSKAEILGVEALIPVNHDVNTVTEGLMVVYDYLDNPNFTYYYLPLSLGLGRLRDYVNTGE